MPGFQINQLFGLAAAKIFCSLSICMLLEASGNIDSDAGVQAVVATENDIDRPVHKSFILKKYWSMKSTTK